MSRSSAPYSSTSFVFSSWYLEEEEEVYYMAKRTTKLSPTEPTSMFQSAPKVKECSFMIDYLIWRKKDVKLF